MNTIMQIDTAEGGYLYRLQQATYWATCSRLCSLTGDGRLIPIDLLRALGRRVFPVDILRVMTSGAPVHGPHEAEGSLERIWWAVAS